MDVRGKVILEIDGIEYEFSLTQGSHMLERLTELATAVEVGPDNGRALLQLLRHAEQVRGLIKHRVKTPNHAAIKKLLHD